MSGSAMTFAYDDGVDGGGLRAGIRSVTASWISDSATGAVTGTTRKVVGALIKGVTIPGGGGTAPTDNYDISVLDSNTVDVLGLCNTSLINRSSTNTEAVQFQILTTDTPPLSSSQFPVACSPLTIAVTNAGNSKQGTLILYYHPAG